MGTAYVPPFSLSWRNLGVNTTSAEYMYMCMYMYIHVYVYTFMYIHVYVYPTHKVGHVDHLLFDTFFMGKELKSIFF